MLLINLYTSPMPHKEKLDTYAAVDLGSNSFHLLVARRSHGELRVLDRIKETVRLGGGLGRDGQLDEATRARALDCLARFGQRLRGIPGHNIRAVGTQTFRRMRHAGAFLREVECALGCPVEIIGGREEARLIYLGVSQGVSGHEEQRLVIDIGGGSTELVIGRGLETLRLESLPFGCVSLTNGFFGDGRISHARWQKARRAVLAELQELQAPYRQTGWRTATGSSGTIREVEAACIASGWCERDIPRPALDRMQEALLACSSVGEIGFPGMSESRTAVIAGGLAMLSACFDALGIETMTVSQFALREGVLHDLLGRLEHTDPRDKTVQAFRSRYEVNDAQAERMRRTALAAFEQVAGALGLGDAHAQILGWAAELHETGLGVSHNDYQAHSGYLVENSDLAGFSTLEQKFLAALVRHHRREIPRGYADGLPERLHQPLCSLLFCLRLAWILCRTRDDAAIPEFRLSSGGNLLEIRFDPEWARGHPLTVTDLEHECAQVRTLGFDLRFNRG